MEVKITDDVQSFGVTLSNRGWVCGLLAGAAGALTYFGFGHKFLPESLEGLPTMIVVIPFLLVGFWHSDKMPFEVWLKNMLNTLVFRRGHRVYRSENIYQLLLAEIGNQQKAEKKKGRKL